MACLFGFSLESQADWRGKWNPEVVFDEEGNNYLYIKCSYSLFVKECDQDTFINVE